MTFLEAKQDDMVKLAAMECFASCVLTYLKMSGQNSSRFLLDYWNVNYQFKTLLSSKDARQMTLSFYYGMEMKFVKGNARTLQECVSSGICAVLLCAASKLPYFPRQMLGLESSGFQHSILIYGRDGLFNEYAVVDPMADYIGTIQAEELEAAGYRNDRRQELLYFTLESPSISSYLSPSAEQLFAHGAERNLFFFDQENFRIDRLQEQGRDSESSSISRQAAWVEWFSNRHGGGKALDMFAGDAGASLKWSVQARKGWIERNNLTIGSMIQLRRLIWDSFCDLNVMTAEQVSTGTARIQQIVKCWHNLNFKLLKYKNVSADATELVESIISSIAKLKMEEGQFLGWMVDLIKLLSRRNESIAIEEEAHAAER